MGTGGIGEATGKGGATVAYVPPREIGRRLRERTTQSTMTEKGNALAGAILGKTPNDAIDIIHEATAGLAFKDIGQILRIAVTGIPSATRKAIIQRAIREIASSWPDYVGGLLCGFVAYLPSAKKIETVKNMSALLPLADRGETWLIMAADNPTTQIETFNALAFGLAPADRVEVLKGVTRCLAYAQPTFDRVRFLRETMPRLSSDHMLEVLRGAAVEGRLSDRGSFYLHATQRLSLPDRAKVLRGLAAGLSPDDRELFLTGVRRGMCMFPEERDLLMREIERAPQIELSFPGASIRT